MQSLITGTLTMWVSNIIDVKRREWLVLLLVMREWSSGNSAGSIEKLIHFWIKNLRGDEKLSRNCERYFLEIT